MHKNSKILLACNSPYRCDKGTAVTPAAKQLKRAIPDINSDSHNIAQHFKPFNSSENSSAKHISSSKLIKKSSSHTNCLGCLYIALLIYSHNFILQLLSNSIDKQC